METINLNYGNFWENNTLRFPLAIKSLHAFIDEYKAEIKWHDVFAGCLEILVADHTDNINTQPIYNRLPDPPKFHDIPLDMQTGIIIRWIFKVTENYPAHRQQLTQGLISQGVELWAIRFNLEWILKVIENILCHE